MPILRLARDKRGLDTLYLLHPRADGRGDTRMRVLYFCASPQGLTFGRAWLDPVTQQALERRYPDVAFDWPALLRELEQRRLPPAFVEPQSRRARPSPKAEHRPPSSEQAAERPATHAKRRRRKGAMATAAGLPAETPSGLRAARHAGVDAPTPIIEP